MPELIENELPQNIQSEEINTNVFSVIRNRRATREYLPKQVSRELIQSLIDYAILAPSAMNLQPWSFVVVQNLKLLKEAKQKMTEYLAKLENCPIERLESLLRVKINIYDLIKSIKK